MPALERMMGRRGARFWLEDDVLRFVNVVDSSTRDGPREATEADKAAHPEALAAVGANDDGLGQPLVSFKTPDKRKR